MRYFVLIILLVSTVGCIHKYDKYGYISTTKAKIDMTKKQVSTVMGLPAFKSHDNKTWYYTTLQVKHDFLFSSKRYDSHVTTIQFDKNNRVIKIFDVINNNKKLFVPNPHTTYKKDTKSQDLRKRLREAIKGLRPSI